MSKNAVMPLDDYKNACNKIREKTETTEAIKSGELSEKINDVYEAGQIAGQKAEHDKFWGVYQENGNRTEYPNTLGVFSGYAFNFDNFYPKYDIRPTADAKQLFYAWTSGNVIGSLSQRLKECGVVLDTSSSTSLAQMFNYTRFTELPAISFESVTSTVANDIRDVFANNPYLETIEKIIVTENTRYKTWFNGTTNLKNVFFEGVIGQNGLDFSPCTNLSKESILNIIGCLKDFRQPTTFTVDVLPITHTTITNGALEDGKEYTWSYYDSQFPGWVTGDDATAAPSLEEVWITSTAGKVIVSGNEYIGFKANWLCYPSPDDSPFGVYVYQDGSEIKVYADVTGVNDYIKIILPTRTITFGTNNLNKLTDAEKAIATQKGWSLV